MTTNPFSDAAVAARYADKPPRQVPGFHDLHTMAVVLLSRHVPEAGRVLVLGAGGGLEIRAFAAARPGWRFDGVDPSAEMFDLAVATTSQWNDRITYLRGTVDVAPDGPYDGAVCLLTLHFIPPDERLEVLRALRRRLRPGGPLVVAHHSIAAEDREFWLEHYAGFAAEKGIAAMRAQNASAAIATQLPLLSPDEDEALLREAGFAPVRLFYAAFTFRGWIGNA